MKYVIPTVCSALVLGLSSTAYAGPPEDSAGGEGSVSLSSSDGLDADGDANGSKAKKSKGKADKRKDVPWLKRWAPEGNTAELGLYGGIFVPNTNHELFEPDPDLNRQGHQQYQDLNADIGARVGYYFIPHFGLEVEGGVMPSQAEETGDPATIFTVRGQAVAQLGLFSVVPFVAAGAGLIGVSSDRSAVGNDVDPAIHFGGGVKIYLNRYVMLRLDVRDVVSHRLGVDETLRSSNLEALLGLSVTLGRKKKEEAPPPPPEEPKDTDGDGLYDDVDQCINDPETVNDYQDDDGCPESDSDGDGFWDDQDACPQEAGVAPDGCPEKDTDGDGILDKDDSCVEEPETKNGFEDADGCPDEVPKEIEKFTGVIEGIYFDTAKDTIKDKSIPKLDQAFDVLTKFPSVKVQISGHTDDRGKKDMNMDLSRRRAEQVKKYFVDKGIDASRITTRGAGPDEPIADNKTKKGRAKNRRIEFKLIQE